MSASQPLLPQLVQLLDKGRLTFRHETIHHSLDELDLVLDREIDEVCIDQYPEGRSEIRIVGEEEAKLRERRTAL